MTDSQVLIGEKKGLKMHPLQPLRKRLLILFVVSVFIFALVTHWRPSPQLVTFNDIQNRDTDNDVASGTFAKEYEDISQQANKSPNNEPETDLADLLSPQIAQPKPEVVIVKSDNEKISPVKEDPDAVYKNVSSIWTYRCDVGKGCIRDFLRSNETAVEPEVCWLNCGQFGALWPYPRKASLGQCLSKFTINGVQLTGVSVPNEDGKTILHEMWDVFTKRLDKLQSEFSRKPEELENSVIVSIFVSENSTKIDLDTDETFSINIASSSTTSTSIPPNNCDLEQTVQIVVQINAITIFGARHGLETLNQLIVFDRKQACFQIVNNVEINDGPVFPYRGILIDTARNWIPIADLKRMIDGMSHNKLNILHWHITDSNAFPFYTKSLPKMTLYGAYSQEKVYYPNEVQDLIKYALIRGVKMIPEVDVPSHAGHGWEWGPSEGLGDLAVCVNAEPWRNYCGQPPCGQLNPLNTNTYDILEKLYQDFMQVFDDDLFHMGGDEVYWSCWASDPEILAWSQTNRSFTYLELWGAFQEEALVRLRRANQEKPLKAIVWTSELTAAPNGRKFLNPSSYIIQVWDANRALINELLKTNYQLIFSNIEAAYLDQGAGTWLGTDHVYTYRLWQRFYDNRLPLFMRNFAEDTEKRPSSRQLLGSEATLWSEKVNSGNMDAKTWPRGAALAENLWSNPSSRKPLVYSRLNHHNRRLISLGIHSDQLQPESCYLVGHCDDPSHHI